MDAVEKATDSQIFDLVRIFYDRALKDADLGPLFRESIPDMPKHLATVTASWASVLNGSGGYSGCVMSAHVGPAIKLSHFEPWLSLFRETAAETLPSEDAERAIQVAEQIAEGQRMGLFRDRQGPQTP